MTQEIEFTQGSGNVFADLDLDNAEELQAKSTLAITLRDIIKRRGLTQKEAARILGTHQTQIARLKNSKGIGNMSIGLLMHWLTKFNRDITVSVKKTSDNRSEGEIRIAV